MKGKILYERHGLSTSFPVIDQEDITELLLASY